MGCEVPDLKSCCFIIPLQYGILTFGYLNLVFTLFVISFEVFVDCGYNPVITVTVANYKGVSMLVQMWLLHFLYAMEVIFDIILLIGAHTKRRRLIRIYYYYGLLTTVAIFLTFLSLRPYESQNWYWISFEYCFAFSGFVLQFYLLMLIRTEMHKLKEQQRGHRYENHMTEVALDPPPFGDRNV